MCWTWMGKEAYTQLAGSLIPSYAKLGQSVKVNLMENNVVTDRQ